MKTAIFITVCSLAFACFNANAQLCTGNLGDPVINQTFGAGNSFTMPRNATTFDKIGGCPEKGTYTISSFLFGCGNNNDRSWIKMIGDHTGDYNGNYMLVNAESTSGTIYTDTAKGLCDNTNYVFAAWVSNAMQNFTCGGNPVLANLTFTVSKMDGTVLATSNTGDIPIGNDKVWTQYGLLFTTPANTPAVIVSITTDPQFGCGGGFVIDDITFRSCGPLVNITLDGSTEEAQVCADYKNPFILKGNFSAGFTDPVVQWQSSVDTGKTWTDIAGETNNSYAIPRRALGEISYRMVVAERKNINSLACRIASNSIYTEVHPVPPHRQPQNLLGCLTKDLPLPSSDPTALDIIWRGPDGFNSTDLAAKVPAVSLADTGLYTLQQNFYFGCISIDSFYLRIFPSTTITATPAYPICEGMSEQLSVSATGGNSYKWTPAIGLSNDTIPNPIAKPADTTAYKVVVTNSFGCKDSALLTLNVYRNVAVSAGPDKVILEGDTATLDATVKGTAVDFSWSPDVDISNIATVKPSVYPATATEYTLTANSGVGCGSASDKVFVTVYKGIEVPNAFTPNGDGKNDVFRVLPLDNYKLVKFIIYNRWGKMIFTTKDKYTGWDGTYNNLLQPSGTYVYYIEMISDQKKKIIRKGTILLLL